MRGWRRRKMGKISYKQIELAKNGFECKPGQGYGRYPFLVVNHNHNDDLLYFIDLEQAYFIIKRDYLEEEKQQK
jgi:hypothetical protein